MMDICIFLAVSTIVVGFILEMCSMAGKKLKAVLQERSALYNDLKRWRHQNDLNK